MSNILRYYGYAEIVLYFLIALLCALRARTASGAYGACFGIFVLWTVPAMCFDAYLGRDIPGIGYLVIAPFYAVASPLMHLIIWRIWKRPPGPSRQSSFVRLCRALGRVAGRASGSSGLSADGERSLNKAIYEQVRREFAAELASTSEYWAHDAIEKKIEDEVKRRMKEVASPQSLWGAS